METSVESSTSANMSRGSEWRTGPDIDASTLNVSLKDLLRKTSDVGGHATNHFENLTRVYPPSGNSPPKSLAERPADYSKELDKLLARSKGTKYESALQTLMESRIKTQSDSVVSIFPNDVTNFISGTNRIDISSLESDRVRRLISKQVSNNRPNKETRLQQLSTPRAEICSPQKPYFTFESGVMLPFKPLAYHCKDNYKKKASPRISNGGVLTEKDFDDFLKRNRRHISASSGEQDNKENKSVNSRAGPGLTQLSVKLAEIANKKEIEQLKRELLDSNATIIDSVSQATLMDNSSLLSVDTTGNRSGIALTTNELTATSMGVFDRLALRGKVAAYRQRENIRSMSQSPSRRVHNPRMKSSNPQQAYRSLSAERPPPPTNDIYDVINSRRKSAFGMTFNEFNHVALRPQPDGSEATVQRRTSVLGKKDSDVMSTTSSVTMASTITPRTNKASRLRRASVVTNLSVSLSDIAPRPEKSSAERRSSHVSSSSGSTRRVSLVIQAATPSPRRISTASKLFQPVTEDEDCLSLGDSVTPFIGGSNSVVSVASTQSRGRSPSIRQSIAGSPLYASPVKRQSVVHRRGSSVQSIDNLQHIVEIHDELVSNLKPDDFNDEQLGNLMNYFHIFSADKNQITLLDLETALREYAYAKTNKGARREERQRNLMLSFEYLLKMNKMTPVEWFIMSDVKGAVGGTGKIDFGEYKSGINKLSVKRQLPPWPDADLRLLLKYINTSADDILTLDEVEDAFRRFHSPMQADFVLKKAGTIVPNLITYMREKRLRFRDLYYQIDTSDDEFISYNALRVGLKKMIGDHFYKSKLRREGLGSKPFCVLPVRSTKASLYQFPCHKHQSFLSPGSKKIMERLCSPGFDERNRASLEEYHIKLEAHRNVLGGRNATVGGYSRVVPLGTSNPLDRSSIRSRSNSPFQRGFSIGGGSPRFKDK